MYKRYKLAELKSSSFFKRNCTNAPAFFPGLRLVSPGKLAQMSSRSSRYIWFAGLLKRKSLTTHECVSGLWRTRSILYKHLRTTCVHTDTFAIYAWVAYVNQHERVGSKLCYLNCKLIFTSRNQQEFALLIYNNNLLSLSASLLTMILALQVFFPCCSTRAFAINISHYKNNFTVLVTIRKEKSWLKSSQKEEYRL